MTTRVVADGACCPACGASDWRQFAAAEAYCVRVCRACGLGRTTPQPSDAMLAAFYGGEKSRPRGAGGAVVDRAREAFARAFAARVARRAGSGGDVLDVGCGDGKVLAALARRGYACHGVELNAAPAIPGIRVLRGSLEEARFPAHAFRIVIVRHVLEHVRDPLATLREIRRVIADDGHLFVAVPNLASWQARASSEHWLHLDVPRHLWHFTPGALAATLVTAGFDVVRVSHFSLEHNAYGWLQSGFNVLGGRWRGLQDQLRSPQTAVRDPLVVLGGAVLAPLCIVLAVVEALARSGGTVELWARASLRKDAA